MIARAVAAGRFPVMKLDARAYPDWKAPAEDGSVLVWPQPEKILQATLENQRQLSEETATIQNVPLCEARRHARKYVGHQDDAQPLLAAGHQSELYHSGVWVKDVLINAAAQRLDGQAYHIAVDTDAPKHLNIRWPGGATPITDDARLTTAPWSGLLDPPTPAHLQAVRELFERASLRWSFEPVLPANLDALRRLALEENSLSSALTNAQHALDWELGLRHHALLASPIWVSEPFALLVHHVIAHADRFAQDYNAALSAYREAHGIRSRTRPMPDLSVSDDLIEIPFWLDDLANQERTRPRVSRQNGAWTLRTSNGDGFTFTQRDDGWEAANELSRWMRSSGQRLAPRALMLTLFVRLCLADQFVHGIGGGRYDQITDALIEQHFGIRAPQFCVTTATLYFPDAVNRPRVCVPCIIHEGHRLRHSVLGEEKRQFVRQIESLPRGSPQRATKFAEMHNALDAAAQANPVMSRWRERFAEAQQRLREEGDLFDRELYYALQPRDRLMRMIHDYQQAFVQ